MRSPFVMMLVLPRYMSISYHNLFTQSLSEQLRHFRLRTAMRGKLFRRKESPPIGVQMILNGWALAYRRYLPEVPDLERPYLTAEWFARRDKPTFGLGLPVLGVLLPWLARARNSRF